MQQTCNVMEGGRHVLYDVFISKTLSLLETEIEITKRLFPLSCRWRQYENGNSPQGNKRKSTLRWNGTDNDLIELVAALMAAGVVDCAEGKKLTVVDVIRVFEDAFNLKIKCLIHQAGKGVWSLYGFHSFYWLYSQKLYQDVGRTAGVKFARQQPPKRWLVCPPCCRLTVKSAFFASIKLL